MHQKKKKKNSNRDLFSLTILSAKPAENFSLIKTENGRKQTNLHNVRHTRSQDLLTRVQPSSRGFIDKTASLIPIFTCQVHFLWPCFFPHTHLAHVLLRTRSGRDKVTCVVWSPCCWTRSTRASLQFGDSKLLYCRGEVFDTQKAPCAREFQVGHFMDEGTQGGGSIFLVLAENLWWDQVRRWSWSCSNCWDLAVHGKIVNKIINRCHRIISEAVILGTLKHALLSAFLHMFWQVGCQCRRCLY